MYNSDSNSPEFTFHFRSKKAGKKLDSRCPKSCPICHGGSPGCLLGSLRHQNKVRRYQSQVQSALDQFKRNNQASLNRVAMMRTLACISHQKAFMFGSFRLQKLWIYPVNGVFVGRKDTFYNRSLPFQGSISEEPYLTWLKEQNGVVISSLQRRNLLYMGSISKVLTRHLIPAKNMHHFSKRIVSFQYCLLRRLFGYGSLRRLILAGGLDWEYLEANKRFLNSYYICRL